MTARNSSAFGRRRLSAGATRKRAEQNIPEEQILVSLSQNHRAFYLQEPGIRPSQRIVQPANKGTAPPILHSLLSIEQLDDDALVAILPATTIIRTTGRSPMPWNPLLKPRRGTLNRWCSWEHSRRAGSEYGWIEVGAPACHASFRVRAFQEKPPIHVARELMSEDRCGTPS